MVHPRKFEKTVHLNQIRLMLYHERERNNEENANFVYIVYLLTKLCNIFDEAFFIDVSIDEETKFDYCCNITYMGNYFI